MKLDSGVMDVLMCASGGDMRKAVGYLQSAHDLSGGGSTLVTADMVNDVSGQVCTYIYVYVVCVEMKIGEYGIIVVFCVFITDSWGSN